MFTSDNTTLTFYCDTLKSSRTDGTIYSLNTGTNTPGWFNDGTYANVTTAVFDSSFSSARPTSTYRWFYNMKNLTTISGIANLNTSEVTYMAQMFYNCSALTSLDLSSFNTAKVTNMMFMFSVCKSLTSLDLSKLNTENVTTMKNMFAGCSALESLDLSGTFNTANVTDMSYIFLNCSALTTIYAGDEWTAEAVTSSSGMFTGCAKLVGGEGTAYNASYVDATYAHIDGGTSNPGYFTAKLAYEQGDVNMDGSVNVSDVTTLVSIILGNY